MFKAVFTGLCFSLLGGCSAISALSGASAELDAYTLSAVQPATVSTRDIHLVVAVPTSAGALATDRILIKPSTLQAQYLPDGRWTDTTPVLFQTLLLSSLQNSGGFLLVDRDGAGLMPDYTVMTELKAFQAEPGGVKNAVVPVRIAVTMTLIRERDRAIMASRDFAATANASSDKTPALVPAFDAALRQVLTDAANWVRSQAN